MVSRFSADSVQGGGQPTPISHCGNMKNDTHLPPSTKKDKVQIATNDELHLLDMKMS